MTGRFCTAIQKGGTGKTTVAINTAGALNQLGRDVLLIDLDPQGNATEGLGFRDAYDVDDTNLHHVLTDIDHVDHLPELIIEHEEMDLVPSNVDLQLTEDGLRSAPRAQERLDMALEHVDGYDYVIADCPPRIGGLTDNALLSTRNVLIPALAEGTSKRSLELLFDQIDSIQTVFDVEIGTLGLVANRVDEDGVAEDMMAWFDEAFAGSVPIWEIRKRVALKRAWANGVSIFAHDEACDMAPRFVEIAEHIEATL